MDDNEFANGRLNNKIIAQAENSEKNSSNSIPVEMVENIVQDFIVKLTECSQNIEKNNTVISEKLSNMITLANFEGKLIELMLQNRYYSDGRGKKVYDKIKEDAKDITLNSLGRLSDTNNLKLYEDLMSAKNEIAELQEAVHEGKQREKKLQETNDNMSAKVGIAEDESKDIAVTLQSYVVLAKWYERLVQEVPLIRKRNSGIIRVQTWEGALECYITDNPKPKITEIDSNDFGRK